MSDVRGLLSAIEQGDPQAAVELLPLVYDELRRLAAQRLAREKPGQTLQATALVHEAYLRLVGNDDLGWDSRGHFFAAAEAMRRILVENAGHGAGPDGQDLGADVDLVGPGPAYERWKASSEYQAWLAETSRMKSPALPAPDPASRVTTAGPRPRRASRRASR